MVCRLTSKERLMNIEICWELKFMATEVFQNPATKKPPEKDVCVSKNRGTPKWMVYNGKPY